MKKQYISNDVQLLKEWHAEKNIGLNPYKIPLRSHKKVWWKCEKRHEWQATVKNRFRGDGCPYCSGRYAIKGETDLLTVNPELALDFHLFKNGDVNPTNVTAFSNKKIYWCCEHGHEWVASIIGRHRYNTRCPYCSGRRPISGKTDLAAVNPKLAKEWNYAKNDGLTPDMFLPNSNRKVWWICGRGHEWQAAISLRNRGNECPYCSGNLPILGETDLATKQPMLCREWHVEKNGSLTPEMVCEFSEYLVWWKCRKCGHEWQSRILSRSRGSRCPKCKNNINR